MEITDAVVAVTRAVLSAGGQLVTAAHPTIAPLLLYVASEQQTTGKSRVVIYQSGAFESVLPAATTQFETDGIGLMRRTARMANEPSDPAKAPRSLETMRHQMLSESRPSAAVFIGGMEGVIKEYRLFEKLFPVAQRYVIGRPGGAAGELPSTAPGDLQEDLANDDVYPSLGRRIVDDLMGRL